MKFILVKNFTDVDLDSSSAPELHLEVEGKSYSIVNLRNLYFCEVSNTLAGREGQVQITDDIYSDAHSIIYNCLRPFLDSESSYTVLENNDSVRNFLAASKKYYLGI